MSWAWSVWSTDQRPGCHSTGHRSQHVRSHRAVRHAFIQQVTTGQKVLIGGTHLTAWPRSTTVSCQVLCETTCLICRKPFRDLRQHRDRLQQDFKSETALRQDTTANFKNHCSLLSLTEFNRVNQSCFCFCLDTIYDQSIVAVKAMLQMVFT